MAVTTVTSSSSRGKRSNVAFMKGAAMMNTGPDAMSAPTTTPPTTWP